MFFFFICCFRLCGRNTSFSIIWLTSLVPSWNIFILSNISSGRKMNFCAVLSLLSFIIFIQTRRYDPSHVNVNLLLHLGFIQTLVETDGINFECHGSCVWGSASKIPRHLRVASIALQVTCSEFCSSHGFFAPCGTRLRSCTPPWHVQRSSSSLAPSLYWILHP